jgi:prepilin-type processing-associated H-X9-DG protein
VTLIEVVVVIAIIAVIASMTLAGVQRVRAAAARVACANNMKQVALATHSYHDAQQKLPPGVVIEPNSPQQYMSWLTRLLPYIEQTPMWDEAVRSYRSNPNPFDRDNPHPLLSTSVKLYVCPADDRVSTAHRSHGRLVAFTSYLGVNGTNVTRGDGLLGLNSTVSFSAVSDGLSNTLLCGERPPSADFFYGWWYVGAGQTNTGSCDMHLGVTEIILRPKVFPNCPRGPYHFQPGSLDDCHQFHFWSFHPGGAHFALADGSVRFLKYTADPVMPALATRAGGEAVTVPE